MITTTEIICAYCGLHRVVPLWAVKRGKYKYCSRACASIVVGKQLSEKYKGVNNPFYGRRHTDFTKDIMSVNNKRENNPMYGVIRLGDDSPSWKGGLTPLIRGIRNTSKYDKWRLAVYERDAFTCMFCGDCGIYLECHHIIPLSTLVYNNNIKSMRDAYNCIDLWNIDNGLTVCIPCHCSVDEKRSRLERGGKDAIRFREEI